MGLLGPTSNHKILILLYHGFWDSMKGVPPFIDSASSLFLENEKWRLTTPCRNYLKWAYSSGFL